MRKSTLALIGAMSLAFSGQANAVANSNAINWSAPPSAFIASLYRGVLGRAPDAGGLASWTRAWTARINANPTARLKVFNSFVNSREHRSLSHSRMARSYAVFYRPNGNTTQYWVAKRANGGHGMTGYMSFREASARRDYYNTFHRYSKDNPRVFRDDRRVSGSNLSQARPRSRTNGRRTSRPSGPACPINQCLSGSEQSIFGIGGSCVSKPGARGGVCGTRGN